MLLAAILLAAAPPARVVVPDAVKKARAAEATEKPPQLPLFSDPRITEALGAFKVTAGAWAEYAVIPSRGPQARMKLSIVNVLPDGRYWFEAQTQKQGHPPVAVKMLLHGPPGRIASLDRLYLLVEGLAPMELPLDDVKDEERTEAVPKVIRKPPQKVTVAKGTFLCEVDQVQHALIFHTAEVPLWGLVRAIDKEQRVELIDYAGKGAETVFPREFDQGNGSESTK